jgi:hypothetical protein
LLTKRQLNRALLARQMLLERQKVKPLAAIERLMGMQAQVPRPPFGGLWTRLQNFERDDLLRLLREKKVVRATAMRGTIHLLTVGDYRMLRPALAAMLAGGATGVVGKRMGGTPAPDELLDLGRRFFGDTPGPFDEFRKLLKHTYPKCDERAMAYTVRMGLPLAMIPTDVAWGFPANAGFALAEKWLGQTIPAESPPLDAIVLRYLAAFGPATPSDAQTWSGLRTLREVFERLRPSLVTFTDEKKRELFDLPDAPRSDAESPAPVRFLPEYDNVLLAHADRSRIISDVDRKRIVTPNLMVIGTFLVDGFVAGSWKAADKKKTAALTLTAFTRLTKKTVSLLEAEGEAMLAFYFPDSKARSVSLAP